MPGIEPTNLISSDGHVIPALKVSSNLYLARMKVPQLVQVAPDPRDAENRRKVEQDKDLQDLQEIRAKVQRMFLGQKAKNVEPYAEYIIAVHAGMDGMTPPIILYSERELPVDIDERYGIGFIQVPYDQKLVAIDGETQLAARYEAAQSTPSTRDEVVPVVIAHGRSKRWAQQAFHDLNVYGVRPNVALSIGMDARDPLTQVAREVENRVSFFRDRVNTSRRQLGSKGREVVTISALRGACVTLAEGIGGIRHGTRPVPVPDEVVERTKRVAIEWFSAVADAIGPAIEDREQKLASAPSVLAAIGAMGHTVLNVDDATLRSQRIQDLMVKLRSIDWRRGKHWEGIAGKFTPKGAFSVGGSKETAYAVFDALSDETSPAYIRIRPTAGTSIAA
jgi:DNA sulfur modification protein DndB